MGGAKRSTWIGGTVFLGLVVVAAAWLLAVSPKLTEASETREEAVLAEEQNALMELKILKLQADYAKLPEYKAQLAALQEGIPTEVKVADYLRELDAIGTARGVTITAVTPSSPERVEIAQPAVAQAPTTDSGTQDEAAVASSTEAPSSAAPPGFTAIPVSISVLGTYDATLWFLDDLQRATKRLLVVSGISGSSLDAQEAGGGKPATAVGDQELVITGYVYVLPDGLSVPEGLDVPEGDEPAVPPLPAPVPGKNPLLPAGRS